MPVSNYLFYIIWKYFRAVFTLDLQLQPQDRDPVLKNPNFPAKSLNHKQRNKISLEQAITFKTGQIIIINKRNKMTLNFFAFCLTFCCFYVIAESSFCHHDVITMSLLRDMKKMTFMSRRVKNVLNMTNLIYF